MKSILHIVSFLILLFNSNLLLSQCIGPITLSTQAQVNAFACTSVIGNLIINDNGTDLITDLSPIFNNGLQNGDVSGQLVVANCPKLGSLFGLHGITKTGSHFIIDNNPVLSTTGGGGAIFKITSVGADFVFKNLPSLSDVQGFQNLTDVDGNIFINIVGGTGNFKGLDNIQTGKYVEVKLNTFPELVGLNGMQQCNFLNIVENHSLVSMDAFQNLQNIVVGNGLGGWFQVANNNSIATLPSFSDLLYADKVSIVNNPQLATCCSALPILLAPPTSASVANNAVGCNSVGQINAAPTLTACAPDVIVNTDNGTCISVQSYTDPTSFDNCDFASYTATIINGNGTTLYNGGTTNGWTQNYNLTPGSNTFLYIVTDATGKSSSCMTAITVEDNQFPSFSTELPSDLTIFTASNSCEAMHTVTFPTGSDNCGIVSREISAYVDESMPNLYFNNSANQGQSYTFPLDVGTYIIEAKIKDATGKIDQSFTNLTVVDNTMPVISNVPADVTINCDDAFPQTPNAIATDNCDPSPSLTASSSVSMGNCTLGTEAQIQSFTWTATDASGNTSIKNWKITVISDFSFDLGDPVNLCDAASYNINPGNIGQDYLWSTGATGNILPISASGTYGLTVTSNNGCCYSDEITVNFGAAPNASTNGAMLSCASETVQISGSSTTANVSYSWTGPGAFTSNMQNPLVGAIGQYTLTVTSNIGCTSTSVATVTADTDVPDASATGGTLSCNANSTQISSSSSTSGVSFSWIGPGGFTSNMQNPNVTAAGLYTVTVLSANGCDATADAVVINDTSPPSISLSANDLDCGNPSTIITLSSDDAMPTYIWEGPSGYSSSEAAPSVTEGGTYSVTITGSNGCTNSSSITIAADTEIPNISATGGILNCEANSLQIFASSTTTGVSYEWSGPDDFASSEQNPNVTQPGLYIILVIAPNGCSISTSIEVEADNDLPSVIATGGEINCLNESVLLQGSTTSTESTTMWSGPNGFTSTDNDIEVTQTGTYKFTVIAASGCEAFKEVEVTVNTKDPDITLFQGDINCELGVRTFVLNTDATDGTFEWSGPDGFMSEQQSPEYSLAGTYSVSITGANGCVTEGAVTVANDISYSQEIIVDASSASISIAGGTPPFIISWDNGNSGETATGLSNGEHSVTVIDGLGCEKIFNFVIGTSSTDDFARANELEISPNPAQDVLKISWKDLELELKNIRVIDLQGQLLLSKSLQTEESVKKTAEINVSSLTQGIYFIQIYSDSKRLSKKFVKI